MYELRSVVVFLGVDNGGHFVVYHKSKDDGVWRKFDEDRITVESEDRVLHQTAAYLVLLERVEPDPEVEVKPEVEENPAAAPDFPKPTDDPATMDDIFEVSVLLGKCEIGPKLSSIDTGRRKLSSPNLTLPVLTSPCPT